MFLVFFWQPYFDLCLISIFIRGPFVSENQIRIRFADMPNIAAQLLAYRGVGQGDPTRISFQAGRYVSATLSRTIFFCCLLSLMMLQGYFYLHLRLYKQ